MLLEQDLRRCVAFQIETLMIRSHGMNGSEFQFNGKVRISLPAGLIYHA